MKKMKQAAAMGDLNTVRTLCLDIRYAGYSKGRPLIAAASKGHVHVVEFLLNLPPHFNVNPNVRNNEPLTRAAENGHLQVVKLLCELPLHRGVDPGQNCVMWNAAICGHFHIVKYLCELPPERGVNPGCLRNFPLYLAVVRGHQDLVDYLVSDPRVNVEDVLLHHSDLNFSRRQCLMEAVERCKRWTARRAAWLAAVVVLV